MATVVEDRVELRFKFDSYVIGAAKSVAGARIVSGGFSIPREGFSQFVECVGADAIDAPGELLGELPPDPFENTKPTYVLPDFRPRMPTWGEQFTLGGLSSTDFQATGSTFIIQNDSALVLDQMGLGKTKEVIDAVSYMHEHGTAMQNVLVVAKASTLGQWRDDLIKFSIPCDISILRGNSGEREAALYAPRAHDVRYFIVSWETMTRDIELLSLLNFDFVCLDEAHKAKSSPLNDKQSQLASCIHRLKANRRMAMTGTFIILSAEDAWNILTWLKVETRTWTEFAKETLKLQRYSRDGYHYVNIVRGYHSTGLVKLRKLVAHKMIRRLRDEELPSLPPFVRTNVEVTLSKEEAARYRAAVKEGRLYFDEFTVDDSMALSESSETLRLKQITSTIEAFLDNQFVSSKIRTAREYVEDFVADGRKVLIGTQFLSAVESLTRVLADFNPAIVHGSVSAQAKAGEMSPREQQVYKFQNDPTCKVFIASVAACREGLTLTEASAIIHVDKEWAPAYVDQFEARANRIGSEKHKSIDVISLIAVLPDGKPTIDVGIETVLPRRKKHADHLTERKALA